MYQSLLTWICPYVSYNAATSRERTPHSRYSHLFPFSQHYVCKFTWKASGVHYKTLTLWPSDTIFACLVFLCTQSLCCYLLLCGTCLICLLNFPAVISPAVWRGLRKMISMYKPFVITLFSDFTVLVLSVSFVLYWFFIQSVPILSQQVSYCFAWMLHCVYET